MKYSKVIEPMSYAVYYSMWIHWINSGKLKADIDQPKVSGKIGGTVWRYNNTARNFTYESSSYEEMVQFEESLPFIPPTAGCLVA